MLNILEELALSDKESHKKAILKREEENKTFRRVVLYALSPSYVFYIKNIENITEFSGCKTLEDALDFLDTLRNREVTGDKAYYLLLDIMSSLSEDDSEVVRRILLKTLKCGVESKTINSVWEKDFIKKNPYMRCGLLRAETLKDIKFPVFGQVKADGQYADAVITTNSVQFFSREKGKEYIFFNHFDNLLELGQNVVLMGELVVKRDGKILPREEGNGIIQKAGKGTIKSEECDGITLMVWDCVPLEDWKNKKYLKPYSERFDILTSIVKDFDNIEIIHTETLHSLPEIQEFYIKCLQAGEEGSIIKNYDAVWKDGTSKQQLKVKIEFDCELEITGFNQGDQNAAFADTLGSLICESSDKQLKVNVSGLSENLRYEIWDNKEKYLGKIVTVTAHRVLNKRGYTLYLPRLKEFREDKLEADSIDRILESEQNSLFSENMANKGDK